MQVLLVARIKIYSRWREGEFKKTGEQKRTALCCVITQRVAVISYRRFGTTYRVTSSSVTAFRLEFLTLEDGADSLSRNVGKELPLLATS
jgi:hypothetical protein